MIYDPKDVNRIRAFSVAFTGLLMAQRVWEKQGFFLTIDLSQTISIGTFICCFLLCIFLDRNEFVQSQKIKSFTPTFAGVGIIVLNIGFYFYWYNT